MMNVIAPSIGSHDPLSIANRGRNRSTSEVHYPVNLPPQSHEPEQLPRSASYTYFPQVKDLLDDPPILEFKGTISEEELKFTINNSDGDSSSSSYGSSPDRETAPPIEQPSPAKLVNTRRSSRFIPFSSKSRDSSVDAKPARETFNSRKSSDSLVSMSPARSLSKLRRKSWISSSSRPSSPTKDSGTAGQSPRASKKLDASKKKSTNVKLSIPEKPTGVEPTESRGRVLTKKPKRPLSGFFNSSTSQEAPLTSSPTTLPQVPKSFSTERLPTFTESPSSPAHIPPLPRNLSRDKLKGVKTEPRKKDELWTVFRTLEADLRKFHAKSIALKANVVRATLLSFLRSYASHPSNQKLRPEDLDRRANILNGWWTGLLELLAGRNNQSISGTDRPAILEGITGIMERPEWRLSPSPFCALADRAEASSTSTTESTASLSSGQSDFLAESVYHNVKNIFTQNLLSQMAFVIDKMSLRNAAASLVTFCGKTCAYVFCFCPGVADVLVRLWDPSLDLMRRVLEESGVSRQDRLDVVADRIVPSFPPNLQSLKFHSLAKTVRALRVAVNPPLGTGQWDWHGPWLKRWSGAESDLFYVFVKHFHILVSEFLPAQPSNAERICVPGLVLVHAQVLANLDATVNRHTAAHSPEDSMTGPSTITFDDVLGEPDTSASALPIAPPNAARQMAENRVIMLIRDFLSERNAHLNTARRIFAEGFARLLKALARKVSIYDNNACYTLCDFLEEAFIILVRYEQFNTSEDSILDWPFWLSVCKQMTVSQNTATEIKLFAFLYSSWSTIAVNGSRRTTLCLDFLLEPEFFESRFSHWCPMVRSYFMRLLCWRVARFDGEETPEDVAIMRALSDRLRSVWSHYLWLREEAELRNTSAPSTTPCNPAPGRRFLIIRNDAPMMSNNGPFISFDGVVQSPVSRRLSSVTSVADLDSRPISAQSTESQDFGEEESGKSRWSLLRNLIGTKPAAKSKTAASPSKENAKTPASVKNTETPSSGKGAAGEERRAAPHRSFSFRFSLEWADKRFQNPQNMRLGPPRLPLPAQFLLQTKGINIAPVNSVQPSRSSAMPSRYAGRALAEWTLIAHECQNFFERRKNEGVPSNRLVETPTLAVEAFRRPG